MTPQYEAIVIVPGWELLEGIADDTLHHLGVTGVFVLLADTHVCDGYGVA